MPDPVKWRGHEIPCDERGGGFLSAPGFELQFYSLGYRSEMDALDNVRTMYRAHLSIADEDTARADGPDPIAALEAARLKLLEWLEQVEAGRRALLGEDAA